MMHGHGTVKDTMKAIRDVDKDDILSALGLERRRSAMDYVLPALGYFAIGLVVGSTVTLLVTPKSGRQMRRELGEKVRHVGTQLGSAAESVVHDVQGQLSGEGRGKSEDSPLRRSSAPSANAKG